VIPAGCAPGTSRAAILFNVLKTPVVLRLLVGVDAVAGLDGVGEGVEQVRAACVSFRGLRDCAAAVVLPPVGAADTGIVLAVREPDVHRPAGPVV
jgi:hypothetical protein